MEKKNGSGNPSETIAVIVTGLVVVFLLLGSQHPGLLYVAVVVGVAAIASRQIAGAIALLWMALAKLLSKVVPVVLLAVLFYLILTPLALLRRLSQRGDPLRMKDTDDSMFVDHTRAIDNAYFEKSW